VLGREDYAYSCVKGYQKEKRYFNNRTHEEIGKSTVLGIDGRLPQPGFAIFRADNSIKHGPTVVALLDVESFSIMPPGLRDMGYL
jgi:hypothetical protein